MVSQARITGAPGPRAASLLTRKTTPSRRQLAGLTRQTQLLDAGQSALQSRSVATIHLFLPSSSLLFLLRATSSCRELACVRPRACNPPPHNPPRASSLVGPFLSAFLHNGAGPRSRGSLLSRGCRQHVVSPTVIPDERFASLCSKHFTTSSSQPPPDSPTKQHLFALERRGRFSVVLTAASSSSWLPLHRLASPRRSSS
jgi:hypothetical protein